jgi:hypothetical protein
MTKNYVRSMNRPLFDLSDEHPARRFLEAFVECRKCCIGLELDWPDRKGIDQQWHSEVDRQDWKYSSFAYRFLAFDIRLDGWLENSPELTQDEKSDLERLPYLHALIRECRAAAVKDHNIEMVLAASEVEEVLDLWWICIEARARSLVSSHKGSRRKKASGKLRGKRGMKATDRPPRKGKNRGEK